MTWWMEVGKRIERNRIECNMSKTQLGKIRGTIILLEESNV